MLTQIDLQHFKCFELLKLPLCPLTLLSGPNSSGKSSVLQALILLQQTMREHEWSTRLMLNGMSIQLGTVQDVVDKEHGKNAIEIGVFDSKVSCRWTFSGDRLEMSMMIDKVCIGGEFYEKFIKLRFLLPPELYESSSLLTKRLRNLTYIGAERLGPREVYSLEDPQSAIVVGTIGEYAASMFWWGSSEHILDELALPNIPDTLYQQVNARMRKFFPGSEIVVEPVKQANAVNLGFRTSNETDFHRPAHAGFGLTQVFPIVVAALSASKDDILLIENPEVHLHPAGQAMMGQFLADVARAGIQVILETHSDHILNGVRRSVKAGRLAPDQVAIHFFRPRTADSAQVISPIIDLSGNIDSWPDGFFDQYDKDMNYFAGWGD